MTSADCKKVIADFCRSNRPYIESLFCEGIMTDAEFLPSTKESKWKRVQKYTDTDSGYICRTFDCQGYDDQLRADVYTDLTDSRFVKIEVGGQ